MPAFGKIFHFWCRALKSHRVNVTCNPSVHLPVSQWYHPGGKELTQVFLASVGCVEETDVIPLLCKNGSGTDLQNTCVATWQRCIPRSLRTGKLCDPCWWAGAVWGQGTEVLRPLSVRCLQPSCGDVLVRFAISPGVSTRMPLDVPAHSGKRRGQALFACHCKETAQPPFVLLKFLSEGFT